MKAKELMIGDWVNVVEFDIIDQILHLTPDTAITGHGDTCGEYEYERLTPIPLTKEILERNGWRYDELNAEYYGVVNVLGSQAPFLALNGSVQINYVHELQHALRLAGEKTEIEL
jgi:hypothetical protein